MSNTLKKTTSKKGHRLINKKFNEEKKIWVVKTKYQNKRITNTFPNEHLADEWIYLHTTFKIGTRRASLVEGTAIQIGTAIFEMIEDRYAKGQIEPSSQIAYRSHLKSGLKKNDDDVRDFANTFMHEIDAVYIDDLKSKLMKGSNGTRFNCILGLIRQARTYYISRPKYINIDQDLDLETPAVKVEKKDLESYSDQEVMDIYNAFDKTSDVRERYCLGALILGIETGTRIGELVAIRISNYDEAGTNLLINQTFKLSTAGSMMGICKSKSSGRVNIGSHFGEFVKIRNEYLKAEYGEFAAPLIASDLLFPSEVNSGMCIHTGSLRLWIQKACKLAKVKMLRPHCAMRATSATTLARGADKSESGFEILSRISEHMRHSSLEQTSHYIKMAVDKSKTLGSFSRMRKDKTE